MEADEGPLVDAFVRAGVDHRWAVWDDPDEDWSAYAGVLIRTTWDYIDKVEAFRESYALWGGWIILLKGMTPIPYKIVTITSGFAGYNLFWFVEACLSNALRMEQYIEDAERDGDTELVEFFQRAQHESQKGADQAKALLLKRLNG